MIWSSFAGNLHRRHTPMMRSFKRTALAAVITAGVLLGPSACVMAPYPTEVAISGPAVYYYTPLFYEGYVVYYDVRGRPYYYQSGVNIYISTGYSGYRGLVAHYHKHRPQYDRWYHSHGVKYRDYRDPRFRSAPPPGARASQPSRDRFSPPPSRNVERDRAPTYRDRTSPPRDDWTGRGGSSSTRFNREGPSNSAPREPTPVFRERTSPTQNDWTGRGTNSSPRFEPSSPSPRFERSAPSSPPAFERGPATGFPDRAGPSRDGWSGGGASPAPRFERSTPSAGPSFDRGAMDRSAGQMDQGRFNSPR